MIELAKASAFGAWPPFAACEYDLRLFALGEMDARSFAAATHELVLSAEGEEFAVCQAAFTDGPDNWLPAVAKLIERESPAEMHDLGLKGAAVLVRLARAYGASRAALGRIASEPAEPVDIIESARNARPDLFSNTDSPQTVSDPMGEALERQREANRQWVNGDGPEEAPQWVPEPEAPEAPEALKGEAEPSSAIPKDIAVLMQPGETLIEARRRLTEILNIELAELVLARGTDKENLGREAEIQRLRNLLARIGEA